MQRLRFYDCRVSRLTRSIGLCVGDTPRLAQYVNSAQRRLLMAKEAGDEGWWGTYAEMAFQVSLPATAAAPTLPGPYLTLPRDVARLESVNICDTPIPLNNQFFEYLQFGNGRLPKQFNRCQGARIQQAFTRNNVPTFVDFIPGNVLQVYLTDPADADKRVFISGTDTNNNTIYSLDGLNQNTGQFLSLASPFSTFPTPLNTITGIQKDVTVGTVRFYSVDTTTGTSTLILTMQPGETTAWYRRYYFDNLPATCCSGTGTTGCGSNTAPTVIPVTAIAKLDLIPVVADTDYCLIQNLEAIIEECESIRYSEVDNPQANITMSKAKHLAAIGLLNGELAHFLGVDEPAVEWAPFGSARLERQKIGTML